MSEWSDEEIVGMAFVARQGVLDEHQKMSADCHPGKLKRTGDRPATTSTLVVGNTAYITSSIKAGDGGTYLYLPGPPMDTLDTEHCKGPLRTALANCQTKGFARTNFEEGHNNNGVGLTAHK